MSLVHQNLTFIHKHFNSDQEALQYLAQQVVNAGYAKDTYPKAVLTREKKFPTGLPTGKINVAIPHADSVHVKTSTLAVMTLDKAVSFHNMGDPKNTLPISIIIMMAIAEPKGQLTMLQKIMAIVQNQEHLNKLLSYKKQLDLFNDVAQTFADFSL